MLSKVRPIIGLMPIFYLFGQNVYTFIIGQSTNDAPPYPRHMTPFHFAYLAPSRGQITLLKSPNMGGHTQDSQGEGPPGSAEAGKEEAQAPLLSGE